MKVWHDLPWAQVGEVSPNEGAIDQKHPSLVPPEGRDAIKWRFGSWSGLFGWISGDRLTGDERNPTRREKVGIKIGETAGDGGLVEVYCQRPNTTEDRDMIRVMTLTSGFVEFHVPIRDFVAAAPRVTRLVTDNGRYVWNIQGDSDADSPFGAMVIYDTWVGGVPVDESRWRAVAVVNPTVIPDETPGVVPA